MSENDFLTPDGDPFYPPAVSTLVSCLHCGQEYESFRIEWRIVETTAGKPIGFWCCPVPGYDGRGFGFDILPVDPNYRDERGGWVNDEDGEDEDWDEEAWELEGRDDEGGADAGPDDSIPF